MSEMEVYTPEFLFQHYLDIDTGTVAEVLAACQVKGFVNAWAQNGSIFQVVWPDTPNYNIEYDAQQLVSVLAQKFTEIAQNEVAPDPPQLEIERDNFIHNATDSALNLANDMNIQLSDVKGTGKDGRVGVGDVRNHLEAQDEPVESSGNYSDTSETA